jgi:hypothetical protein
MNSFNVGQHVVYDGVIYHKGEVYGKGQILHGKVEATYENENGLQVVLKLYNPIVNDSFSFPSVAVQSEFVHPAEPLTKLCDRVNNLIEKPVIIRGDTETVAIIKNFISAFTFIVETESNHVCLSVNDIFWIDGNIIQLSIV